VRAFWASGAYEGPRAPESQRAASAVRFNGHDSGIAIDGDEVVDVSLRRNTKKLPRSVEQWVSNFRLHADRELTCRAMNEYHECC
jgi:hypothetical protein